MSWFERPSTTHEQAEYSRLRELYTLMKRWKEHLPELPWEKIPILDRAEQLGDAIDAETPEELLTSLKLDLRRTFESWKSTLETAAQKPSPTIARVLRLTEEEAVRYTSAQWKGAPSPSFHSIATLFAAYRETPFFTLYRDSLLLISSRARVLQFILDHPAYEMETAWMRGFATVLRPHTQISARVEDGKKIYEWKD